ncbi:hypothetical protein [Polaribacter porphyrae]|uniref:Right handed beta helix domain-containing protein n=1 Tax=Polaribacter porphyrae TaxID=1137780 RepID=A0A2S7WQG2_9FLAO|nr:hypothetical protein [Polaribacter porphyrae]PQJ79814.1 hypothetical protein BTO18_11790 [Polaribacter porphyrae]
MAQIKVADFGAIPNDGKDDLKAIKNAVKALSKEKNKILIFEEGTYDLFFDEEGKERGIRIYDQNNVTFLGKNDKDNNPLTTLLRHHKVKNNVWGKTILEVVRCDNFKLKNFIFDNFPRNTSAGKIIENNGNSIVVKVFEGNPIIANTRAYCANTWNLENKTLLPVESITYGGDVSSSPDEHTWHIKNKKKRLMELKSSKIASKVKKGEAISWHFGYSGIQVSYKYCDNLNVENVTTYNAIGFCMEARGCGNIYSKNVRFKAPDNQLAVGSRDAWKIYASNGNVVMDNLYVEGVRWDGQNVHGSFAFVHEIIDDRTIWFKKKYKALLSIRKGSIITLSKDNHQKESLTVESFEKKEVDGNFAGFQVTFKEKIPSFVNKETLGMVMDWNTRSYTLKNSTFKNIAGSASILRNSNSLIHNNTFSNIMYPLTIGGTIGEGEGVIPNNVTISNNKFTSSGWVSRHTKKGAIVLSNWKSSEYELSPFMKNIRITDNEIINGEIGINVNDADGVYIFKNKFENTERKIVIGNAINIKSDEILPKIDK